MTYLSCVACDDANHKHQHYHKQSHTVKMMLIFLQMKKINDMSITFYNILLAKHHITFSMDPVANDVYNLFNALKQCKIIEYSIKKMIEKKVN